MQSNWQPKPGDKVIRPLRIRRYHLRRVLGVPALFSAVYGDVGSSIYYALGIVALVAMGATPIALGIAGIFFIFTALTYAEGTAMIPEAGGSASFARHGFNELVGFTSGWALMLSYILTVSISAFTIPPYLGYFWPPLKEEPVISVATSMGIILFLMVLNILGVKGPTRLNIGAAILDLTIQAILILSGFILIFNLTTFIQHMSFHWPTPTNLVLGIAIAALAYTGVETASQLAEETRQPEVQVPRAYLLMIFVVLIMFSGISTIALSAMTPMELVTNWAEDPVAGIANSLPLDWLRTLLQPMVAVLAATILLIAGNDGILGISRLAFSMGVHRQLPSAFSKIHHRFRTPYVPITLFTIAALLLQIPGFFGVNIFANLGALYTFGSLLAFALAHASILSLRIRKPELPRPFKLGWNIRIGGYELPITAILGLIATTSVWLVIVIVQPYSRWIGFSWMAVGLVTYLLYRQRNHLSLTQPAREPK